MKVEKKISRKPDPSRPGRKPLVAPEGYMTTVEVADALKVDAETVRSWIKRGHLKPDRKVTERIGSDGSRTRTVGHLFRTSRIEIIRQKRAQNARK